MNVLAVMNEIGLALQAIDLLAGRIHPFQAAKVTPPAAIVDLPDDITFDGGYARGMDRMTVPFTVVVGMVSDKASTEQIAEYLHGSGPRSVKAAVERHVYSSCDSVTVVRAEVAVVTFAAVQYLGALFTSDVVGRGA